MLTLDRPAARRLLLAAQGLEPPREGAPVRTDVLASIRRMGALQIDTIHVVARSPYLVLWSRLGAYEPRWLDELLAEGALFEAWSHEACFLPIDDYPLHQALRQASLSRVSAYAQRWLEEHRAAADALLQHVRERGPVRSADFARTDGQAGGWWNWKFEKMALEMLFASGELMIARRERFQRIYDLRERVLPGWDEHPILSPDEALRATALKAVRALGVATARWVPDYFRIRAQALAKLLPQLAAAGLLAEVRLDGWAEPAYVHPDNLPLAEAAAAGALEATRTTLLSPFDPVVWDRARALALFDFDYRIECYTPAPKRRYGYFTLPILHRGALVGRLDPKAHRREGLFEIKALYLEPGVPADEELVAGLAGALRDCAAWHATPQVVVQRSEPPELAGQLQRAIDADRPEAAPAQRPRPTDRS